MNRVVPWVLGVLLGVASLFPSSATANAIYDVEVNYAGNGHTATYSFTMEFATKPTLANPASASDLINPDGDFSNEKMVVDGIPNIFFTLDRSNALLAFDGTFLQFISDDVFGFLDVLDEITCQVHSDVSTNCTFESEIGFSSLRITGEPVITERLAVPVPATLALLGLGLAGLGWSRRKK